MFTATISSAQQVNYVQKYSNAHMLHIKRIGQLSAEVDMLPAGHDYYRVILITEGVYEYAIGKCVLTLNAGSMAFIKPGEGFNLPDVPGVTGYIISFNRNYLQSVFSASGILEALQFNSAAHHHVCIATEEAGFILEVFGRLYNEYQEKGINGEMVVSLFHILILVLRRSMAERFPVESHKGKFYINRFFSLLESHFHTCKMPFEYAALMAVTPAYLNYLIKDSFGCTTSHFIQQRIFSEAKRLITYDSLSMKEVAYRLGFDDISHFSKFFKRVSGKRFTDFKRSLAV